MTDCSTKFIGLDVHKETISVGIADSERGEVRFFGRIPNTEQAVKRLVERLAEADVELRFCYEAGPCGYGLYRQLIELGHECQVVAALIPRRPGDRVKTDRRDALSLSRLHRAGELMAVWVPDPQHEAMRDLSRCREDAKIAQRKARQHLNAFLLRSGRHYRAGKRHWTLLFFRRLEEQKFDPPVQQIVFQEYVDAVVETTSRVKRIEQQLREAVEQWTLKPLVVSLMALRGVQLVTAVTVLAELGDLSRFDSPRQFMAYLGLAPGEHSSGGRRRQGSITKTGNGRVRRVLVESAWTYRHPARKTPHLQRKAEHASKAVQAIAWKAQRRLCARFRRLEGRGKRSVEVCTAVARELCGFLWAMARETRYPEGVGDGCGEPSLTL